MDKHYQSILLFIILSISINSAVSAKLETFIKKCPRGDFACEKKVAQELLPLFAYGVPELDILPLEPLTLARAVLEAPSFKFTIENYRFVGFSDATVEEFRIDLDAKEIVADVRGLFNVYSNYEMTGQMLLIPINGRGDFNCTMYNFGVRAVCPIGTIIKDGREYVEVTAECDIVFNIKDGVKFMISNLVDGNKILSDAALKAMNDDWEGVVKEVAPYFRGPFAKAITSRIKPFFAAVPLDQIIE